MSEQERRIASYVEEYDAQGWHRTGTAVDVASCEWLAGAVRAIGLEPASETYGFDRVEPQSAFIEVVGRRLEGLPLFDCDVRGAVEVEGSLGPLGSDAEIGLALLEGPAAIQRYETARRQAAHRAIVAVTVGRRPGLMARNATDFKKPFGPPVLQVESAACEWLEEQAAAGARAKLALDIRRRPATSANVVAVVKGRDPDLPPVMVTTPRSGWWQCASERGGGLAAWLEVMRSLAGGKPARDTWFVAFSGHELGHFGGSAFVERHPELVSGARAWVHFGANVGGAQEPAVRVSATVAEDLSLAEAALKRNGVNDASAASPGTVQGLESQLVHSLGGRVVSLLGGNAFFHLESDRWPVAVDVASVARQANAAADLAGVLERS
jgi:hypothetical protein